MMMLPMGQKTAPSVTADQRAVKAVVRAAAPSAAAVYVC